MISAITSCTNTSNPSVMLGAGELYSGVVYNSVCSIRVFYTYYHYVCTYVYVWVVCVCVLCVGVSVCVCMFVCVCVRA